MAANRHGESPPGIYRVDAQRARLGKGLAIQTTGFGFAGASGVAAGQVVVGGLTAAALAIGLAVTPVGWLIIIGTAIAVGYAAATTMDKVGQNIAGSIYDKTLNRKY